ncbi:hypothetical protein M1N81_02035 [Dehalococcoidia bacterium]|nr:hypothetical protein [Dehalococcoidia bacterium]MCL0056339.1 hypothetical protein [Dehalococcoidia bacterium]
MAKRQEIWIFRPVKQPKTKVTETVKKDLEVKASELIESVLKPKHVKPPSQDEPFNYIVDIYAKWYRNYFYFCAKYRCPGPNAVSPFLEEKFARLKYISNGFFNLSYMRRTGQWREIYTESSVGECLAAIRDEPHFLP